MWFLGFYTHREIHSYPVFLAQTVFGKAESVKEKLFSLLEGITKILMCIDILQDVALEHHLNFTDCEALLEDICLH